MLAYQLVSYFPEGSGQLYGTDFSPKMVNLASSMLKPEIAAGKVHLNLGSVEGMPYDNGVFDRVFHCNCFYFWADMDKAVSELKRVIRPDGKMVCIINIERLKELKKHNLMQCGNIEVDRYMSSLETHGFNNVHIEDVKNDRNIPLHAIYATAKRAII